jgi:hypothetical protein
MDRAVIEGRGRALVALVEDVLPVAVEVHDDSDAWPAVGTSLVSLATGLMKSILDLSPRRPSSAAILLRSLYEYAVHLAWLGADPGAGRIEAWRKDDLRSRLKADAEWRHRGVPLLTDENRAEMQRQVASLKGAPLILANLAAAADQDWSGKLPGIDARIKAPDRSFRGQYTVIYRYMSTTAHPSFNGINRVLGPGSETGLTVHLEEDGRGAEWDPLGAATLIYGLCLFVASASLGWPSAESVDDIFHRFRT